jgi:hypothetical protein
MTPESNARLFHVRILLEYLKAMDPSVIRNLADVLDHEDEDDEDEWEKQVWAYGQHAIATIGKSRLAAIEAEVRKVLK